MAEIWKVNVPEIFVRNGPGSSYTKIGTLSEGAQIEVTESGGDNNAWKHFDQGWCLSTDGTNNFLVKVRDLAENEEFEGDGINGIKVEDGVDMGAQDYLANIDRFYSGEIDTSAYNFTIRNAMGIMGLPYQFLPSVDTRLSNEPAALGRKYAEKIISRAPILFLTPGEPEFMAAYSKKDKQTAIEYMLNFGDIGDKTSLDSLLSKNRAKFYNFKFAVNDYYNYVNPICRIAARFLGIQWHKLNGIALANFDWSTLKSHTDAFVDSETYGAIPFYIDSDTQISESFSNSTSESQLASTVNGFSDMASQMNFLLGYGANAIGADGFNEYLNTDIATNVQNASNIFSKFNNRLINGIAGNVATVVHGGKLIFPEMWGDSDFSRSYSINIRLITPDCDTLSWYFNIWVPLAHLLALVAPRTLISQANGFTSPFLVRGYYKGLFNCDMGIITSMSINKGQEAAWTKEGLPTVVEVSLELKDLYSRMSITSMINSANDTLNNTFLMDYIANACGINSNKPDVLRLIDMWFTNNVVNRISDTFTKNIWGGIEQAFMNTAMKIYRGGM